MPPRRPARLKIKVTPASSRDGVMGWLEDTLKVRVRAPAEGGRANEAVVRVLAGALAIPTSSVRVARGHGTQRKILEFEGLDTAELWARLPPRDDGTD